MQIKFRSHSLSSYSTENPLVGNKHSKQIKKHDDGESSDYSIGKKD